MPESDLVKYKWAKMESIFRSPKSRPRPPPRPRPYSVFHQRKVARPPENRMFLGFIILKLS